MKVLEDTYDDVIIPNSNNDKDTDKIRDFILSNKQLSRFFTAQFVHNMQDAISYVQKYLHQHLNKHPELKNDLGLFLYVDLSYKDPEWKIVYDAVKQEFNKKPMLTSEKGLFMVSFAKIIKEAIKAGYSIDEIPILLREVLDPKISRKTEVINGDESLSSGYGNGGPDSDTADDADGYSDPPEDTDNEVGASNDEREYEQGLITGAIAVLKESPLYSQFLKLVPRYESDPKSVISMGEKILLEYYQKHRELSQKSSAAGYLQGGGLTVNKHRWDDIISKLSNNV